MTVAEQQGAAAVAAEVTRDISDGAIKLWTTAQVLRLRRAEHALFRHGSYLPLYATGAAEQHVIAHARQYEDKDGVIVAVPRFACSLMRGEVALPLGQAWKDWSLPLPVELHGSLPQHLHRRDDDRGRCAAAGAGLRQLSGCGAGDDFVGHPRAMGTRATQIVTIRVAIGSPADYSCVERDDHLLDRARSSMRLSSIGVLSTAVVLLTTSHCCCRRFREAGAEDHCCRHRRGQRLGEGRGDGRRRLRGQPAAA